MAIDPINIDEYQAIARSKMDRAAFDYYEGGAEDEVTLAENRDAFRRITLRPRVLVDVSQLDSSTEVLGERLTCPVLLAPAGYHKLAHPEGEMATARAAGRAGTVMVVSTMATCSLEEIAGAATGSLWFQLYVQKDRERTRDLVARAQAAGYRALVLTADVPVLGRRERDVRNQFMLPAVLGARNLVAPEAVPPGSSGSPDPVSLSAYIDQLKDDSLTWNSIEWLRSVTSLPILIKGILIPEDAREAAASGAAGIIVSNHGGRQLDGVEPSILALPRIVDAVGDRLTVLMDGGIRRGTDVLKALALGARAVLIARPYLWGLTADGERGVEHVLDILRVELCRAMALSGRPSIRSIDRSLVSMPK